MSSTAFGMQVVDRARRARSPPTARRRPPSCSSRISPSCRSLPSCRCVAPGGAPFGAGGPWEIVKAVAALAALLLGGRYLLNPFFRVLALTRAREVMTAAALLVVLGAAALMEFAGLSMAMGAFLAGLMLAEFGLPPRARGRHRAVPQHPLRPLLHRRRHGDQRRQLPLQLVADRARGRRRDDRQGGGPLRARAALQGDPQRRRQDRAAPAAGGRIRLRALRLRIGGAGALAVGDGVRRRHRHGDDGADAVLADARPLPPQDGGRRVDRGGFRGRRRQRSGHRLRTLRADPCAGAARQERQRHHPRRQRRARPPGRALRLPHLFRRRHAPRRAAGGRRRDRRRSSASASTSRTSRTASSTSS